MIYRRGFLTHNRWNSFFRNSDTPTADQQARRPALRIIAGLRELEEMVEEEARKMPLLNDILENRVLGREFKRGELSLLRRQIEERFGPIPQWAADRLVERSAAELEELGVRVLKARTIEELFA